MSLTKIGSILWRIVSDKRTWLCVFVILVILAGYGVLAFLDHDPRANVLCSGGPFCHGMRPFYDEFMKSPHANFNCHVCHGGGIGAIVKALTHEIPTQILKRPSAEEIAAPTRYLYRECLQCHREERLKELEIHRVHLEVAKEMSCSVCHSTHLVNIITIDNCIRCHRVGVRS